MLYPNQVATEQSIWSRVYSYPLHDGTHASFRLFTNTGSSVEIRANFDNAEANRRIPYLTAGPVASLRGLQRIFPQEYTPHQPIPVYRVRLERTAIVWSTSLTDLGEVRPTFIHADNMACTAHVVYLTWPQLMHVYREEGLGLSTRFAMSAVLRRTMRGVIPLMPELYSSLVHLYRPLIMRHGTEEGPILVSTPANIGTPEPVMPRLSHYSMLQKLHGCADAESGRLQSLIIHAARNLAYRMAIMSALNAGPMRFVGGELTILNNLEDIRRQCAKMCSDVPATLEQDSDDLGDPEGSGLMDG